MKRKVGAKTAALRASQFRERVLAVLQPMGLQPTNSTSWAAHQYHLDTALGRYECTIYSDWVAGRFVEVARAAKVLGREMNQHSGKWNHHYFSSTMTAAQYAAGLDRYFAELQRAFERVTIRAEVA